ncbi:MAG: N-acetylneuraminate synthase family protein [Candidatus Omnitrophica bacterium]|nr:N-acetylneuraminate synthase family protein [Candidatus Omnitrophota bacterium]
MKTVQIKDKKIGDGYPVYIVAEIGGNFSTYEEGRRLIEEAIAAGVNGIKIQTFKADTLAARSARYEMENTGNISQWELFKEYELSEAVQFKLFNFMAGKEQAFFSTPSHYADVEFLEQFHPPVYKIGSDDWINIPFLRYVARLRRPIIMSLGMCTMHEAEDAVSAILEEGNNDLVLMHCVTAYPAKKEHSNLKVIQSLKEKFNLPVGFSDHSIGYDMSYAAVALGAHVVERHFTLDKSAKGPDHQFSLTPQEMKEFVAGLRELEIALGDGVKKLSGEELLNRKNNSKSIVSTQNIHAGDILDHGKIAIKRPGMGIEPKFIEQIIGKRAIADIEAEQAITWEMIK